MARRIIKIGGINGNGTDGVMSVILAMGLKYYNFYLALISGSCSAAQFTSLKVLANNAPIHDLTGTDRDYLNKLDGMGAYTGDSIMRIPMEMIGMIDAVTRLSTALNCGIPSPTTGKIINSARLEWTTSGATTPTFEVYAEVDDADDKGPGAILRTKAVSEDASSGEYATTKLPYGSEQWRMMKRIGVVTSGGATIDKAKILFGADNKEVFNALKTVNDRVLIDGVTTPGSDFAFVVDFGSQGMPEFLDTKELSSGDQNLQLIPNYSAGNSPRFVVEAVGAL